MISTLLVIVLLIAPALTLFAFFITVGATLSSYLAPTSARPAINITVFCLSIYLTTIYYKPALASIVRNTLDNTYTLTNDTIPNTPNNAPYNTTSIPKLSTAQTEIEHLVKSNPHLREFCTEQNPCTFVSPTTKAEYLFWSEK
jgi:hypothetical protein